MVAWEPSVPVDHECVQLVTSEEVKFQEEEMVSMTTVVWYLGIVVLNVLTVVPTMVAVAKMLVAEAWM